MTALLAVASVALAAWLVLLVGRGGFWRVRPKLDFDAAPAEGESLPRVVAVIPARNEEAVIEETLATVLDQDYAGEFSVVLVDDRSDDRTARLARDAADHSGHPERLTIVRGEELPPGWAGKVWAMHQGSRLAEDRSADYLWFTDADIAHDPGVLRALLAVAKTEQRDLVSVMAQLRVEGGWDRLLVPAFVYFFAKLYPFSLVANRRRKTAGAAGGCVLLRREALRAAGGLTAIRGEIIDDCALGRLIKRSGGRLWLGFSRGVRSTRIYATLRSTWDMVARSAFHQLNYSSTKLLGTVLGMILLYAVPPLSTAIGTAGVVAGSSAALPVAVVAGATWILMTSSFIPILRHQESRIGSAPLLPVAGALYTAMTFSSAWRHWTGHSREWRAAADASD